MAVGKVLVTGGGGYVGSHTVLALLEAGFAPVVLDNFEAGHRDAVAPGAETVEGDIRSEGDVARAFARGPFEAILHFAGLANVPDSFADPAKCYAANITGGLNLLAAARRAGVRAFVFSSSAAVYGPPETTPIPEDHPQRPISPYGFTKGAFERVLADFGVAYGIRSVSLRYFNAAGADPAGRAGERHHPETHLIPIVLQHLKGKRPCIKVFGTDYPTPDGSCIRDYIHVSDLAEAHVLAVRALAGGGETTSLNLGVGHGYSVREVIATAERVTGLKATVMEEGRRAGDPPVLVADARRAAHVLGWTPKRPSLESIVADAWRWESHH
ncbi:MAG TPA: UDP-glucose 4-epimerase GalE [Planctomycetota bacterium]|nr:UDP-glucose 4-epimerase GalE [Planctomycetota bacterium]HRR80371.1 UDP-glucose 4-epimerase GalE [Planctomycetota bacterium]